MRMAQIAGIERLPVRLILIGLKLACFVLVPRS